MSAVYLAIAILLEISGTTALKLSNGFTRPGPTGAVVVCYIASFWVLSLALRGIDLSTAYAVWSGIGHCPRRGDRHLMVRRSGEPVEARLAGADHRRGGRPASCRARLVTDATARSRPPILAAGRRPGVAGVRSAAPARGSAAPRSAAGDPGRAAVAAASPAAGAASGFALYECRCIAMTALPARLVSSPAVPRRRERPPADGSRHRSGSRRDRARTGPLPGTARETANRQNNGRAAARFRRQ